MSIESHHGGPTNGNPHQVPLGYALEHFNPDQFFDEINANVPGISPTGVEVPEPEYTNPAAPHTPQSPQESTHTEDWSDWYRKPAGTVSSNTEAPATTPIAATAELPAVASRVPGQHYEGRHAAPRRRMSARIGDLAAKLGTTLQETQSRRTLSEYASDKLGSAEAKDRSGAEIAGNVGNVAITAAGYEADGLKSRALEGMRTAWKNHGGKLKAAGEIALGVAVSPIVLGVEAAKLAGRTGREARRFTNEQITATRISFHERGVAAASRKEIRAEERAQNIRTERAAQVADLRTIQQQELEALQAKQARKAPSGRRATIVAAKQQAKVNLMQAEHVVELDDFNHQTKVQVAPHYDRANALAAKSAQRQNKLTTLRMKSAKRKAA